MDYASQQVDQILKNITRQISLDKKEIEYFTSILDYKVIKRKEFLLEVGNICNHTNYVIKGCLRVYNIDERGITHISVFAIEDYWIADLYSFLTQTPATLNLDALEDTEIFQITKSNMTELYTEVPKFERFFRIMHQNAFIAQNHRLMKNISSTAEVQYLQFRKKYPNLESRIPQKQIAAYLGITPEFLSKIKKRLVNV